MSKRISSDIFVLWKNSHKIIYNFIIGYKISFLPDWTHTYIRKKISFLKSNVRKYIYVFFFNVKNKMCKINVCIIFFRQITFTSSSWFKFHRDPTGEDKNANPRNWGTNPDRNWWIRNIPTFRHNISHSLTSSSAW